MTQDSNYVFHFQSLRIDCGLRGCQSMSKQILHFELILWPVFFASFLLPKGSSRVAQVKSSQGVGSTLWAFGTLEEIPGVLGGWVRWWKNCLRKAVAAFMRFLYVAGSLSSGEDVSFWQFLQVFDEFEFRFSSLFIIATYHRNRNVFPSRGPGCSCAAGRSPPGAAERFPGRLETDPFLPSRARSGTFYNKLCWG